MLHKISIITLRLPIALLTCCLAITAVMAENFDDSEIKQIKYPSWFKQSFYDLNEDLDEAIANDKQGLMLLFTTQGCSYCDVFIKKSLGNNKIAAKLKNQFDTIGLEIFDDAEMTDAQGQQMRVKEFAKNQEVMFAPSLVFLSKQGNKIFQATGYQSPERFNLILDYVTNKQYQVEPFKDYVNHHRASAPPVDSYIQLKQDPLFRKPPHNLAGKQDKSNQPMVVIFEKVACQACKAFHSNVLAVKEVRDTLRQFEVIRLNTMDKKTLITTLDGKQMTPASWFNSTQLTQLPSLQLYDKNGQLRLQTDALVLHNRMLNSLHYILEGAYTKDWTYQRFARSKGLQRNKPKP